MANSSKQPQTAMPLRYACQSGYAVLIFIVGAVVLLTSDLALKSWAVQNLRGSKMQTLIPKIIALAWTENHGAVFGMMQNQQWIFVGASGVAIAVIAWIFCNSRVADRSLHAALALILAGALGNLYDRIAFGFVRDMLYLFPDVKWPGGWAWPNSNGDVYPWIFNLADVFLLIGIIIVITRSFRNSNPHTPTTSPAGVQDKHQRLP